MCFICQSKTNQKIVCNQSLITKIFINEGIVIPNGNRICKYHLTETGYLYGNSIAILKNKANEKSTGLNPKNIVKLLNDLGSRAKNGKTNGKLSFDENSLSNEDYHNLTGIHKDQFDYLLSFINVTRYKYSRCALGAFMLKLRCGLSLSKIGSIIAFYNKKGYLSRIIKSIREELMKNFVPYNIGFGHLTKQDVIDYHTRPLANDYLIVKI